MKTERVLQVVLGLNQNGIDNVVMNLYRHIDRQLFQFDFAVFGEEIGVHEDEARRLGARVFHLPRRSENCFKSARQLGNIMRREDYRIVHAHQDCLSGSILEIAKKAGVPIRIAHAHTTQYPPGIRGLYYRLVKHKILRYGTHFIACTRKAGAWMFGPEKTQEMKILMNAVDAAAFSYSPIIRDQVRLEKHLDKNVVLLNVGRLAYAKNQNFLLEIIPWLLPVLPELKLLLVGEGELETDLMQKCEEQNLLDHVIFMGASNEVERLLQAADVMVMPSFFEGLPLAGIEAQIAGLPLLLSDGIDRQTAFTPNVHFCSLEDGARHWADQILSLLNANATRRSYATEAKMKGFDIGRQAKELERFYQACLNSFEGSDN